MTESSRSTQTETPAVDPAPESPDVAETAKAAGRTLGRAILWGVVLVSALAVLLLLFLLGPLGLLAVIPAVLVIWMAAAFASAGPAAGA